VSLDSADVRSRRPRDDTRPIVTRPGWCVMSYLAKKLVADDAGRQREAQFDETLCRNRLHRVVRGCPAGFRRPRSACAVRS